MHRIVFLLTLVVTMIACSLETDVPVGTSTLALSTCTSLASTDCQNGTGPHASGSMAGDVSGVTKTFSGADNEFITLAVLETVIGYVPLEAHLFLTGSPDYDLYVYDAALQASRNCTNVTQSSTFVGNDTIDALWNDDTSNDHYTNPPFPVMIGDSRRLTIEIRSKTSTCGGWTLTITGKS